MRRVTENPHKLMFTLAAWFNWLIAASFIFATNWTLNLWGISPVPESPVYLHFFGILVFMFGVGYFWISRDPVANRPLIKLGAIGKLLLVGVGVIDVLLGFVSWQVLMPLSFDLLFSVLFFLALRVTPLPAHAL